MHEFYIPKGTLKQSSIRFAGVHREVIDRMFADLISGEADMCDDGDFRIRTEDKSHVDC